LAHLKPLIRLRKLVLDRTQITDAGLDHLRGLTELRSLTFGNTRVTYQGVKRLQEALPNWTDFGH
jgi:hypothetical protein